MLADGGSTDETPQIIEKWAERLAWWRSGSDDGQSAAINEALAKRSAPYVCWLNADDTLLPGGLQALVDVLEPHPEAPAVYGYCWTTDAAGKRLTYITQRFSERMLANRCFIAQPCGGNMFASNWVARSPLRKAI